MRGRLCGEVQGEGGGCSPAGTSCTSTSECQGKTGPLVSRRTALASRTPPTRHDREIFSAIWGAMILAITHQPGVDCMTRPSLDRLARSLEAQLSVYRAQEQSEKRSTLHLGVFAATTREGACPGQTCRKLTEPSESSRPAPCRTDAEAPERQRVLGWGCGCGCGHRETGRSAEYRRWWFPADPHREKRARHLAIFSLRLHRYGHLRVLA